MSSTIIVLIDKSCYTLRIILPHSLLVFNRCYYKDPSTKKHFLHLKLSLNKLHLSLNHKIFDFVMATEHHKNTWLYGFDLILRKICAFMILTCNCSHRTGECPVFTFLSFSPAVNLILIFNFTRRISIPSEVIKIDWPR